MEDETMPEGLKPWEQAQWRESQKTGQPYLGLNRPDITGLEGFEEPQRGRALAQGASYNFADEAEAAMIASATGRPYPEVISEIRTKLENYKMENPVEYAALEFAGGLIPSAAVTIATKGRATGPVTAEKASGLFTKFFPNLAKTMGLGAGETVVSEFGRQEGDILDRLDLGRMTGEALTGGGVSGGLYAGGKGLLKGLSIATDVLRIVARRTDQDIINREIQRIADDAGVSVEDAAIMLANGEAVANNPQVAQQLAAIRARSPQASQAIDQARPRVEQTQGEAAEVVASGLGGGMNKNTFEIARANEQDLKKITDKAYQAARGVNNAASSDLVNIMREVILRSPASGRKIQEAFRSLTGKSFFKINDKDEIEFLVDPTILDAEYLMRVVGKEADTLITKGGADAEIGINLKDAADSLRPTINRELPEIQDARAIASNAFEVKDAYQAGKRMFSKSPEEVEVEFLKVLESGNAEAIDAFRLGFLANIKSTMAGANKTTFINNLLDETNKKGMNLRTVFPPAMLDEALDKLGIAQRTQRSFGTMTGGSDTAQKLSAIQRQGSASGPARLITEGMQAGRGDINAAAGLLDKVIRQFAPNLSDSQAGEVARVLLSQDPDIVRKALTDRTVLRQVQTTIADVSGIPLQVLSQNVGKATAAAIGQ